MTATAACACMDGGFYSRRTQKIVTSGSEVFRHPAMMKKTELSMQEVK
jgi:hypothetical protein